MATTDDFSQPIIEHQYTKEWDEYRFREAALIAILISSLPGVAAFHFTVGRLFSDDSIFLMIVSLAWMAGYAIAGHRFARFRCPRCHEQFFCRNYSAIIGPYRPLARYYNALFGPYKPFAKKCWNCGLEKWAGE